MLRILHDTKIDFIRYWKIAAGLTIAFVLAGLIPLFIYGVNYSIEFTSGTVVQVRFPTAPDAAELRNLIHANGFPDADVAAFGSQSEFVIKARASEVKAGGDADVVGRQIENVLKAKYPGMEVVQTEEVGPRVGAELRRGAMLAILVSFGVTLLYLAWRFEWRFGVAAVLATAHDILATLAFIKLLNLEVSLTVIAAILTVIGYSLNDTIIIFDRVRENLHKSRKEPLYDLLNRSVNETLPRSVLTHATTLAATIALLIWAGDVIRPFAWVMSFGIFTGTFSSIYVASPVLLWIERKFPRKDGTGRVINNAGAASPAPARAPRAKTAPKAPTATR